MALTDVTALQAQLDWTLSEDEVNLATGALEYASELVKLYGLPWTAENAPEIAKRIVMAATTRYLRNPDGYTQSRAGDETVAWSADGAMSAGGVMLTSSEVEILDRISGRGSLDSIEVTAWGPSTYPNPRGFTDYVPTQPGTTPFPFWGEPW